MEKTEKKHNIDQFTKNDEFEILTSEGFKDFEGVIKNTKEVFELHLENKFIRCTADHRVLTPQGWREVHELVEEVDVVQVDSGWERVIEVIDTGDKDFVYDAVGVEEVESYYTGGVNSHNCALLYIDEVAFIENDMEFWESTLPTLASAKSSRAILTSTPKGERGLFYKIWKEAEPDENGETNGFHRTKVAWHDVPPYAEDPEWEPSERRRIGDARFEQEYNCSFKGSSNTLIQNKYLEKMITKRPIDEISEFTKIFSKYDEEHRYVAVADVGGGVGKDYSVLTVFDVTEYPFRIAAKYRNNKISPLMFPHTIISMCKEYGNCPVLVETNNDVGGQAITVLWYEMEYEETIMTSVDQKRAGAGIRIGGRMGKPGIKTTSRVRNIGCSNLKTLIEQNQLIIEDLDTIQELGTFIDTGTRFEADKGCHDDCVMTLVLFSWLTKQEWFVDLFEKNVSDNLMKTSTQKSIEEMMPFGGINRGSIGGSARTVKVSPAGRKMKVQEGGSLEEWMKS